MLSRLDIHHCYINAKDLRSKRSSQPPGLPDLIHSTYVLVMPGLSVKWHIDLMDCWKSRWVTCVRATVLPPKINLPILQDLLRAFCRRGWPIVRCVGTHNRVTLTDELQDCTHGFFVQITITRAISIHAVDVTRWCSESGQLMHLDISTMLATHGLTLFASSMAPCWSDRDLWEEWLLMELRHRYLALLRPSCAPLCSPCFPINDLDACYDCRTHLHGGGTDGPVSNFCGGGHGLICASPCGWFLR